MMWTGDQHVDWSRDDGLPSVIPATLSLAMSGYGLTHSDVGGYTTIMDLHALRLLHKAELIPTPGQSEQEYLKKWLTERKKQK